MVVQESHILPLLSTRVSLSFSVPASCVTCPPSVFTSPPHGSFSGTVSPPPENPASSPGPAGPVWLHLPPGAERAADHHDPRLLPNPNLVQPLPPSGGCGEQHCALEGCWTLEGLSLAGPQSTLSPHLTPPDLSIGRQVALSLQPQVGFILEPGVGRTHSWVQVLLPTLFFFFNHTWQHSGDDHMGCWRSNSVACL